MRQRGVCEFEYAGDASKDGAAYRRSTQEVPESSGKYRTIRYSKEKEILNSYKRESTAMNDHFMTTDGESARLDQLYAHIQETLAKAQEIGRVNNLEAFHAQAQLKQALERNWQQLTQAYRAIEAALQQFPALPAWEQIQWAQRTLALPHLVFMEIDTTGLDFRDEIIRFTLVDREGKVLEDCLIQPATRTLDPQVSETNGIKPEVLEDALPMAHAWGRIQQALRGRSVISFGLEWDLTQLNRAARLHNLAPVQVRGECLQRHATRYYNREYSLKLAELCARVGAPLPDYPNQTSLDRAHGQLAVLQAFAQAVTDVRPPVVRIPGAVFSPKPAGAKEDFDPYLDSDDLP